MTNFEFKARLDEAEQVRAVMRARGAEVTSLMRQVDTYFNVPQGRLKLREIAYLPTSARGSALPPPHAELIFYERANEANVKRSDYYLSPVAAPETMCALLIAAWGLRITVKKNRELYLLGYENQREQRSAPHIRVHLDQVEGLGSFVEVEAVVGEGISIALAQAEAQLLLQQFQVQPHALIMGSYSDLLEAAAQ